MNDIRCPECGGTNVECIEKSHHDHICYGCGHTHLGVESDLPWFIRREADLAARPGQMDRLLGIAKAVEARLSDAYDALAALASTYEPSEVEEIGAELEAAYSVIRRFVHGWMPDAGWTAGDETFNRWYLEPGIDDTDIGGTEPMTDAEGAAIRAATADPTPEPETPR